MFDLAYSYDNLMPARISEIMAVIGFTFPFFLFCHLK